MDLTKPEEGPLHALLSRIGERLRSPNRKIVAASFALRYGRSSATAIGPYLVGQCVPDVGLENVSLRFSAGTLFERVALRRATGVMLARSDVPPHPDVRLVRDSGALLARVRDALVETTEPVVDALYRWSRFPRRAIWGQVMSSWGAPFTQVLARTGVADAERAVRLAEELSDDERAPFKMRPSFYPVTCSTRAQAFHRRASCCLYYKVPNAAYCASCPLIPEEESVRRNREMMMRASGRVPRTE